MTSKKEKSHSRIKKSNSYNEEVKRLYLDEGMHLNDIASLFGVTRQAMLYHAKKLNLWNQTKFNVDEQLILDLSLVEGKTTKEINELTGYNLNAIYQTYKKHKIKGVKPKRRTRVFEVAREHLYDLYINHNMTAKHIAAQLNTSTRIIQIRLKEEKIKRKPKTDISRGKLHKLYITENKTMPEICELLKMSGGTLHRILVSYGLRKKIRKNVFMSVETLHQQYIVENMTIPQLAKLYGLSENIIKQRLFKNRILKRKQ